MNTLPEARPLRQPRRRSPTATRRTPILTALTWLFEVVFDYGEHTTDLPAGGRARGRCGQDPFSSFRSGFEIRTYRLCQRVLMFHEIPEELGAPARLVKAHGAHLRREPRRHVPDERAGRRATRGTRTTSSPTDYMPTLRLDYTRVGSLSTTVSFVAPSSLAQAPAGIDGQTLSARRSRR